jgi:hypothetical protein
MSPTGADGPGFERFRIADRHNVGETFLVNKNQGFLGLGTSEANL